MELHDRDAVSLRGVGTVTTFVPVNAVGKCGPHFVHAGQRGTRVLARAWWGAAREASACLYSEEWRFENLHEQCVGNDVCEIGQS